MKQALAELKATKDDASEAKFSVASAEASKEAKEFQEGMARLEEEQRITTKLLAVQAEGLASADAKFKSLEDKFTE